MEVIRKCKKEVKKVQVGDQIILGRYTATAVAQDANGTTFCFDQVYGESPMKLSPFDTKKFKTLYKSKAMDSVREFLVPVFNDVANVFPDTSPECFFRFPTAEEIFAKQHLRSVVSTGIPGADKCWEAMKNASYRTAYDVNGTRRAYWAESLVKSNSPIYEKFGSHVYVNSLGAIDFADTEPDDYIYWRPVFKLNV